MLHWFDPDTFWLTVTNIGLGVVTLICCIAVAVPLTRDLAVRVRRARRVAADDHAFVVPGLGITMADGGENHARKPGDARCRQPQGETLTDPDNT